MHREGPDGREQKRMVVVGGDESSNRDQAVAARTIFHQDRLAPAGGQSIREQSRRNVRSTGGSERHDETNCSRRIGLRRRAGEALQNAENILRRKVSPIFLSPEDWRRKAAQKGSFVRKISARPKLFILGSEKDIQI